MKKALILAIALCVALLPVVSVAEGVNILEFSELYAQRMQYTFSKPYTPKPMEVVDEIDDTIRYTCSAGEVTASSATWEIKSVKILFLESTKGEEDETRAENILANVVMVLSALEYDSAENVVIAVNSDFKSDAVRAAAALYQDKLLPIANECMDSLMAGKDILCYQGVFNYTLHYDSDTDALYLTAQAKE